ncbi:MarC family protein [cf. Phormidesmis sp. LEGE 11477]|uniref:MarC family protein n=1 Tax=cf. Phormidesmis sp. LEGE 11477 TaxID=1828680 RepID=UPI00188166C8|nr:MarC family protein [cf. Phormidesmis sp. LEGE 11477]MBE9064925.1 MarC family protein [cf. Phormidesmis sp. LEGE 11477]
MPIKEFADFILGSIAALFPVIDPIGSVPIFLVLTAGVPESLRRIYARRIALNVIFLLVGFLLVGGTLLRFFGVSLEVVRIAGGIVVFHAAWNTMNAESKVSELENRDATDKAEHHKDISFMPMTIPLLSGPGAIAVALGLAAEASQGTQGIETARNLLAIATAICLIGLIIYVAMRSSTLLLKVLGAGGIQALSRLLGLFVMAIGVQLILNGLGDWIESLNL